MTAERIQQELFREILSLQVPRAAEVVRRRLRTDQRILDAFTHRIDYEKDEGELFVEGSEFDEAKRVVFLPTPGPFGAIQAMVQRPLKTEDLPTIEALDEALTAWENAASAEIREQVGDAAEDLLSEGFSRSGSEEIVTFFGRLL